MGKNYALQNQVYLYSLETSDFYTDDEKFISDKYFKTLRIRKRIKTKRDENSKVKNFLENKRENDDLTEDEMQKLNDVISIIHIKDRHLKKINEIANSFKSQLNDLLEWNKGVRTLREDSLRTNKVISLFESTLTRICKMKLNEVTEDLFVVRVFHYQVLKSIIEHGFMYKDINYQYFTSSAGQIRTKKIVCINENLYNKYEKSITCGLTRDDINAKGGINTNKYQAYLALSNSASMEWKRFNIDRMIVVDDFSTNVHAKVDFIDRDTYEITRKEMDMPIEHMDGCGIMLPTVSKKSFMFRMPWMKGLLTPFDFKKFALLHNKTKVTDIYGKEYDIIGDNINIILTKSQFKLWKYYDSWEEYKENYKQYKCEASKLNIEDIGADANLNYQMLQTLTTMTDEELTKIAQRTIDDIVNIGSDKETMLRVLGATKENNNKNYFQKALLLYPELLNDPHSKQVIKDKKKSLVRDARSAKLRVNGKYTYIIPDVYAFCEWLFLGIETPEGLLKDGEVYCEIFKEGKVDVLRSPHLYKEHAVRKNIKNEQISDWFTTKGIYTSTYDLISRILQFDVDGDKGLVVQDETLIEVAEREMEDVVPLYYEMAKAEATQITSDTMYTSLTSAYKANIGIISNDITKIWNSDEPSLDAVKWLTLFTNFTIDFAKTLFLPLPPKEAEKKIKSFTKKKLPYFFKFAKEKEESQVEQITGSTVNRLYKIIPNKRIQFKKVTGKLDYKVLMKNKKRVSMSKISNLYDDINKKRDLHLKKERSESAYYKNMREKFMELGGKTDFIIDSLVFYLYVDKVNKDKSLLWNCFGEELIDNIKNNKTA